MGADRRVVNRHRRNQFQPVVKPADAILIPAGVDDGAYPSAGVYGEEIYSPRLKQSRRVVPQALLEAAQ